MPDSYQEMRFPVAGVDVSRSFSNQQPRPLPQSQWSQTGQAVFVPGLGMEPQSEDVYGRTCAVGVNVRGYEATTQRRRGGSRAGLSKFINAQPASLEWVIQELSRLTWTGGTAVQQSQSGRVVTLVVVIQGQVYIARAGDTAWTATNSGTGVGSPPLIVAGVVYSASNSQKLFFAEGSNYCYYDPQTNTVAKWKATAGTLPVDAANNYPRLICNWRGRIVLSGLFKQPQAIFMSAVDDPFNWNYAPLNYTPTQAFATTLGPQGSVGEPVTALIPVTDDVLLVGTSKQIYLFNGDPQAGGQISLLTRSIGIAWGMSWAQDPYGTVYFVSNSGAVYTMVAGQQPQRISQAIDQTLQAINTGTNGIRLVWSDRFQGMHLFVTGLTTSAAATHFFYEARTGAWWTDTFGNNDHNPIACVDWDGNTTGDRTVLIGGWDGYVRQIDPTAVDDDGTPISSAIVIGPILSKNFDTMRVDEMVVDLGETSGAVSYGFLSGTTAEAALSSTLTHTGSLTAGRSTAQPIRIAAHAVYLKVTSTVRWAMERIRVRVASTGMVRARGK